MNFEYTVVNLRQYVSNSVEALRNTTPSSAKVVYMIFEGCKTKWQLYKFFIWNLVFQV
jgi:hypothetical protein